MTDYFNRPWIGLVGAAGAGKDTVAEILELRSGYKRVAFADPVRQALLELDPLIDGTQRVSDAVTSTGWEAAKRNHPEIRTLLQRVGTDMIRTVSPHFWVTLALKEANEAISNGYIPVFTDTRFQNELDLIRINGGIIIKVERPEFDNVAAGHVSEELCATVHADYTINNDGDLETLYINTNAITNTILEDQYA